MKTNSFRQARRLFCTSVLSALLALCGASTPAQAGISRGINITEVNSYSGERTFADAMTSARPAWTNAANTAEVPMDAGGWPLSDASIVLWEGVKDMQGTYAVQFKGKAKLADSFSYAVITPSYTEGTTQYSGTYDAITNTTTATMVVASSAKQNFYLNVTNSRRTAGSALNTGITDLKIMRPKVLGGSVAYPFNTVFTDQIKSLCSRFAVLRMMAFNNANSNKTSNWSDRTLPTVRQSRYFGGRGAGAAWEYQVMMANETGKDLWICVPLKATDDYLTKLAQLMRYGSDGVNPYTSTQANPVYPPLGGNIKLYIEYSNEIWNYAPGFDQSGENYAITGVELAAGNSPLTYDGNTDQHVASKRRVGKRTKEISDTFRTVFGDGAMMTRIRPILMWQYGNLNGTAYLPLKFLNDFYNNGDGIAHVATPRPVSYYLYGAGGAFYSGVNNSNAPTIDEIYASGLQTTSGTFPASMQKDVAWAKAFALKTILYEGGFQIGGDNPGSQMIRDSNVDPRAKQFELDSQALVDAAGVDMAAIFFAGGESPYSRAYPHTYATGPNLGLNTPKLQAIDTLNASAPAPLTNGVTVAAVGPTTLADPFLGGSEQGFSVPPLFRTPIRNYRLASYLLRVTTAGRYSVTLNTTNAGTDGKLRAYVDGSSVGSTINVPQGTNQPINLGTYNWSAGLHSVRLDPLAHATTGSDAAASLVSLVINPVPPAVNLKINFQPVNTPLYLGYQADTGAAYGDRGNGQTFGWANASGVPAANPSTRDRNSTLSPDQRYDTLILMQYYGTYNWRIAIPNGSYSVRIVAGDPIANDSTNRIDAEGVLVVNGPAYNSNNPLWIEGTQTVTVSDGVLDVTSGTGSYNNKICFIEITDAPPSGGSALRSAPSTSTTTRTPSGTSS